MDNKQVNESIKISNFWMEISDKFIHMNPSAKPEIQVVIGGWYDRYLIEFNSEYDTQEGEIQRKLPIGRYSVRMVNGIMLIFNVVDYEIFQICTPISSEKIILPGMNVILNSGSPNMSVHEVVGNDVKVQWFGGTELHTATFHKNMLTVKIS